MKANRPLTANLRRVLDVIDCDTVAQTVIYNRLGHAEGVGALLAALEKRGLIERTEQSHCDGR
jgi:hypothetical protein